jgi:tetratricopeptide (TPR) repeat protein
MAPLLCPANRSDCGAMKRNLCCFAGKETSMKYMPVLLAAMFLAACSALPRVVRAENEPQVIDINSDSYAAISYSPSTGKWAYSYSYGDRWSAEKAAVEACKDEDARALCWVNEGFAALALGKDKEHWGWGTSYGSDASSAEAVNIALEKCKERTTDVHIVLCLSSDGQFIQKPQRPAPTQDNGSPTSTGSANFETRVSQLVKEFGYSDQVAADFVNMVRPWKFDAAYQETTKLMIDASIQKITFDQYAQKEEQVANQLAQTIRQQITPADASAPSDASGYYDLAVIVKERKAQSLGYSEVFFILGNAIGLGVDGIDVIEPQSGAQSGAGHMACQVTLFNSKALQVDLTQKNMVSKQFVPDDEYSGPASYHELKDKANRFNLFPRIQTLKKEDLISAVYRSRARASAAAGQLDQAVSLAAEAIRLAPYEPKAYLDRGNICRDAGQTEQAVADFTKVIGWDPKDAGAYNSRAGAYLLAGKTDQAISDYAKAIEINPKDAEAFYNRAVAYKSSGQGDKAISDFTKSIGLDAKNAFAYYNRAAAYGDSGKLSEAVADYTKAIELNPKYAKAFFDRGVANAKLGKTDNAKLDLRKAIQLAPGLKDAVGKKAAELHLDL